MKIIINKNTPLEGDTIVFNNGKDRAKLLYSKCEGDKNYLIEITENEILKFINSKDLIIEETQKDCKKIKKSLYKYYKRGDIIVIKEERHEIITSFYKIVCDCLIYNNGILIENVELESGVKISYKGELNLHKINTIRLATLGERLKYTKRLNYIKGED